MAPPDVKNLFLPGHKKFTSLPWRTPPPPQYPLTFPLVLTYASKQNKFSSRGKTISVSFGSLGRMVWLRPAGGTGYTVEASCFYKKQTVCLFWLEICRKLFSALGRDWEKNSIRNYFFRQMSMNQEDFRQEKFVKKQSPPTYWMWQTARMHSLPSPWGPPHPRPETKIVNNVGLPDQLFFDDGPMKYWSYLSSHNERITLPAI